MRRFFALPGAALVMATMMSFQPEVWSVEPYDTLGEMGVEFMEREFYSGDPDGFGKGEFAVVRDRDRFELQAAIPHLSQLKSLAGLSLERCSKITHVEGIQELRTLRALNIMECEAFESLDALKGHPALESLDVGGSNALKDAGELANLPKLVHLEFAYCNSLTQINGVKNLPKLRSLAIEACPSLIQSGLRTVPALGNLEEISVSDLLIEDMNWVRGLRKLTQLHVRGGGKLTSLRGLESVSALKELELQGVAVNQTAQLNSLKKLESLSLMRTELKAVDGVKGLPVLRDVFLSQNPALSNINGLRGLSHLERLQIESCPALLSLEPIRESKSLKLLKIPADLATKPVISSLKQLEVLALHEATPERVGSIRKWVPKTEVVTNEDGGNALARFFGALPK